MAIATYDLETLRRELSDRSAIFTRAAHALELAATQLPEAPGNARPLQISVKIRAAAMNAMHGALGALELHGFNELAEFLESILLGGSRGVGVWGVERSVCSS